MRTRIEPLTWVLAGVAGWAVLCALIALAGFGGHYELAANDPRLAPALPPLPPASSRSAMLPLEAYGPAYNHPLFYPDRKPVTVHVAGQDAATAQPLDVTLISVIMTPKLQMAIVEDPKTHEAYRVKEGQAIGGSYSAWKLSGLSPRQATFDGGSQGQTALDLRVFDGHGGEEPTRSGLTPQAVASGVLGPATTGRGQANAGDQPPPPDADTAQPNPQDAAAQAANAAAQAAQQAEQIRQRIEARRQQAQAQRAAQKDKD